MKHIAFKTSPLDQELVCKGVLSECSVSGIADVQEGCKIYCKLEKYNKETEDPFTSLGHLGINTCMSDNSKCD